MPVGGPGILKSRKLGQRLNAVQAALKANPSDKLLKIAADDIDVLGGVNKEKLQKLKLLMELLDS